MVSCWAHQLLSPIRLVLSWSAASEGTNRSDRRPKRQALINWTVFKVSPRRPCFKPVKGWKFLIRSLITGVDFSHNRGTFGLLFVPLISTNWMLRRCVEWKSLPSALARHSPEYDADLLGWTGLLESSHLLRDSALLARSFLDQLGHSSSSKERTTCNWTEHSMNLRVSHSAKFSFFLFFISSWVS